MLAQLADALDRAAAANGKQGERVFLGAAAKIADGLHQAWTEWFEENRSTAIDVPIRLGLFGTGVAFLHWINADSFVAVGGLATILRRKPARVRKYGMPSARGSC